MYPNASLQRIVNDFLNRASSNLKYHLFFNNHTVAFGDDLGNFFEVDNTMFPGYAAIGPIAEPAANVNITNEAHSDGTDLTWTVTGAPPAPLQVYGIFVTVNLDVGGPFLWCAWNFSAPATIAFSGDFITKRMDFYAKNYNP